MTLKNGELNYNRINSPIQRRQSVLKSGGRGSGSTKFWSFHSNFREISIFSRNFSKNSNFPGKFLKNFDFSDKFARNFDFSGNFFKNFRFSRQKLLIYSYFWKIILFLFNSTHFRTYLLYMIRYIPRNPCPKYGGRDLQSPRIDAPASIHLFSFNISL